MNNLKILISAILSGICIGIGGVVFLSVEDKLIGSFFFTTGLFVICTMGLHLFTGKVCYVFKNDIGYALSLPVIWGGNFIGTFAVARLISMTRVGTGVTERAAALCSTKLQDGFISLFILGIFCDIMIYIGVEGYKSIPHEAGKYLSLFFGVMVFILCGYEHCIADMFYFSAADMWSIDALIRVLVITFGNAVGGVLFPVMRDMISAK